MTAGMPGTGAADAAQVSARGGPGAPLTIRSSPAGMISAVQSKPAGAITAANRPG
jgi:hypothetical protein